MTTRTGTDRPPASGIDWAAVLRSIRDGGVLSRHARMAAAVAHAPLAFVRLDDGHGDSVSTVARDPRAPVGTDPGELDELLDRVIATGERAAVNNATEVERIAGAEPVAGEGVGTVAAVPIRLPGYALEGAVAVGACDRRCWTDRDLVFLDEVAGALAEAVERNARGDGLERRVADLESRVRYFRTAEDIARLAGGIAHDFNNLMLTMSSYTQLMLEVPDLDEELRHDLLEIEKAVERATALAGRLLNLSRRERPEWKLLDLNEVVDGMRKMLGRLIGDDVLLETTLAPDLAQVRADPGQIEQVILNLVVNARDAMPDGGTLTIRTTERMVDAAAARRLGLDEPGHYVVLAIEDTGKGIDEALQERIFEPFFTTKPQGKGTGIGLATVDAITRRSGGAVEVDSAPGEGSRFRIHLPAAEIRSADSVVERYHDLELSVHETASMPTDGPDA